MTAPQGSARAARAPSSGGAARGHSLTSQDRRLGYALVAPVVMVLLAITAHPFSAERHLKSFHYADYLNATTFSSFAGFSNYSMLFHADQFVPALVRDPWLRRWYL